MTIKSKVAQGLVALVLAGTLSTGIAYPSASYYYVHQYYATQKEYVSSKNLAVILIDMQDSFLDEVSKEERNKEIPYQLDVLDYCKDNRIPVFVLEYHGCGETVRVLKEKVDSLPVKTYITKHYDDGFFETSLEKKLREQGVESILLMGVNASGCVRRTAESAVELGFKILTSKGLIADPEWHVTDEFIINKEGKHGKSDESAPWYKEHGIYREDYKGLLDLIKKE